MLKLWHKYKIIKTATSIFKLGEVVVITSVIDEDDRYKATTIDGGEWWYITEDDVEPLDEPSVIE